MFGIQDLALFMISALLLIATPGADMLYIASRSSAQGFRAGAMAVLGTGAGCLLHISCAMAGLSVILATSAFAFTFVKYLGAAYLIYMGISMLRDRNQKQSASQSLLPAQSLGRVFAQGMLVNVLNPKVALFFLAFVPQFIDTASTHKVAAFFILGMLFNSVGTLCNLGVAWSSASLSHRFKVGGKLGLWMKKSMGGLFIVLGLKLVFSEQT